MGAAQGIRSTIDWKKLGQNQSMLSKQAPIGLHHTWEQSLNLKHRLDPTLGKSVLEKVVLLCS